jgi:hypothetical protein
MTHFTVAIIVPHEVRDIDAFITQQMEPFDENAEVPTYVAYSIEQAAEDLKNTIRRLELIVSRNEPHYNLDACREQLVQFRQTTPEEHYQERLRFHERFNDEGEPVTTYNPDSKWDWYVVGGRWDGWINDRETSAELVTDNLATTEQALARDKIPHAIVTPDGEWNEQGQMGWWGMLLTENEHWDEQAKALFAQYPGHRIVIVDAHI